MTTSTLPATLCCLVLFSGFASASAREGDADRDRGGATSGRLWDALTSAEEDVERAPADPEAWERIGRALLELGQQARAGGGNRAFLYADAAAAFTRTLELDPSREELLPLAFDACMGASDFAGAKALALRGVGTSVLAERTPSGLWLERVARAERFLFFSREGREPGVHAAALERTATRLEGAEQARPEHAPLYLEHARFLEGAGLQRRAVSVLTTGLERVPGDAGLHRRLIDLHVNADVPERLCAIYDDLAERFPQEALVRWYRAWVEIVLGERDRADLRPGRAEERFTAALAWAGEAAERSAEHEAGARALQYRARLGLAFCALDERRHDLARERFVALVADAPERREERDGVGRTVIDGIGMLGARYVEASDYAAGARLMRLVSELLPGEASWHNNVAYMLRQHATFLEGRDGKAAAREVFVQSWEAYQRAVELEPENVRSINDCALIQIYHLRDDLPLAERMLHRAIEIGESQLDALGPQPDETARYPLALAVGDAYENLGYLYYHVTPDPERSREYYERSLATDSGQRWTVGQHLEALRGERESIAEHDLSGKAPSDGPRQPSIAWEFSLEGAREHAREEGVPVFVYYRGDALTGIDGDYWLHLLSRTGMGEALETTAPLVADRARHTTRDRRADGTPIACPRYGAIPCGAHVQVADDYDRLYAELMSGALPGGNEEGYHLFHADGTAAEWNPAFLEQLGVPDDAVTGPATLAKGPRHPGPDARECRTRLQDAVRSGAPDALTAFVPARTRAERAALEALVFDPGVPSAIRAPLLAALDRTVDADSRDLLAACLHQSADEALQIVAANTWSDAADVRPLMRAAEWGTPPVSRAALDRLRELAPGPRMQGYLAVALR